MAATSRLLAIIPAALVLSGCGLTGRAPAGRRPTQQAPAISISPGPNAVGARPDRGLTVRATHGTLTRVTVYAGRHRVTGTFDSSHAVWRSDWPLSPGTEYAVSAVATGPRGSVTQVGKFRTRPTNRAFFVRQVIPLPGETVGVGMPIIVTFTGPVRDKAAVERALRVHASKRAVGAWHWMSDTEVVYRTRRHWTGFQQVVFTAHLSGVRTAPGTYGTADHRLAFAIGRRQISTVNARTHRMLVRRDGKIAQRMAISAGKGTSREYTTTSGVHLTMDKSNPVRMISPNRTKGDPGYYDVMIDDAVRISNTGEYVHAKNNLWAQGHVNVSHGCVNVRPNQAAWFYANSLRGDPVVVTGTRRELDWRNGWGFWQLSWNDWLKGSALHGGLR